MKTSENCPPPEKRSILKQNLLRPHTGVCPWLILLLFIGIISGSIISIFESALQAVVAVAFFIPMISGMTGNIGTQSLAVVVRGLSTEEVNKKVITRLIFRETIVGILIGLVCGLLISLIAYIWQGSIILDSRRFVLVFNLNYRSFVRHDYSRSLIPPEYRPGDCSGPLITTLNDIFSLTIYFSLATTFYQLFFVTFIKICQQGLGRKEVRLCGRRRWSEVLRGRFSCAFLCFKPYFLLTAFNNGRLDFINNCKRHFYLIR